MALPGVKVGPLDPDATESFGQVSASHSARRLIRLHAQMHPPALKRALAKKLDVPRTAALYEHMDEVREYLSGLKLENGDPVVPEGAVVEGAQVRGEPGTEQQITFTYRVPSGRSGKWFAPYGEEALPDAFAEGTDRSHEAKLQARGLVAWDSEGLATEQLRRELGRARRREEALRAQIEGRAGEDPDSENLEASGSLNVTPDVQVVEDNERLGRENEEFRKRLASLEAVVSAIPGGQQALLAHAEGRRAPDADGPTTASQDEPLPGYDEKHADEVRKLATSDELSSEQARAVLEYERSHQNRRTVVGALERRLDASRE